MSSLHVRHLGRGVVKHAPHQRHRCSKCQSFWGMVCLAATAISQVVASPWRRHPHLRRQLRRHVASLHGCRPCQVLCSAPFFQALAWLIVVQGCGALCHRPWVALSGCLGLDVDEEMCGVHGLHATGCRICCNHVHKFCRVHCIVVVRLSVVDGCCQLMSQLQGSCGTGGSNVWCNY